MHLTKHTVFKTILFDFKPKTIREHIFPKITREAIEKLSFEIKETSLSKLKESPWKIKPTILTHKQGDLLPELKPFPKAGVFNLGYAKPVRVYAAGHSSIGSIWLFTVPKNE